MPKTQLVAVVMFAAFVAGCAVSPEAEERRRLKEEGIEAVLAEPLDVDEYGSTKRCLQDSDYRNFRVLDDRRLLFEGRRGKQWINTLSMRCPDMRHGGILRVRSRDSFRRICAGEIFAVDDWFTWPWYRRWPWRWGSMWSTGMSCTLGSFQPVSDAQVEAIEDMIRAN